MSRLSDFFKQIFFFLRATVYRFWKDDCYTQSSILTFYTLQSLVPFLAFLIGISKGFGLEEHLIVFIKKTFSEQSEVMNYAIEMAQNMLAHINSGLIVGVGVLLLFWTNLNLFGYIEAVLNGIWKIGASRSLFRKFTDYFSTIILSVFVFILSSSLTVYLKLKISNLQGADYFFEGMDVFLLNLLKLFPLILSWLLFFILYFFIPYSRIGPVSKMIASFISGSFFLFWQIFYINFQSIIFNYNVVYGTFAIFPLFIVWLQVSWMIVLAGAELAAVLENRFYEESLRLGKGVKINKKEAVLLIARECVRAFYLGAPPLTAKQIALLIKFPLQITYSLLNLLKKGEILIEVQFKEGKIGYVPFADPSRCTFKKVCDVVSLSENFELEIQSTKELDDLRFFLNQLEQSEEESPGNVSLRESLKEWDR